MKKQLPYSYTLSLLTDYSGIKSFFLILSYTILLLIYPVDLIAQTIIWDNTTGSTPIIQGVGSVNNHLVGQQFIVKAPNELLQQVQVCVTKYQSNSTFSYSIYADNGSDQIGNKLITLYSSDLTNYSALTPTWLTINSVNSSGGLPIYLSPGKYWVILSSTATAAFSTLFWINTSSTIISGEGASHLRFTGNNYDLSNPFYLQLIAGSPTISSAAYNVSTGDLVVTATNLVANAGSANDIVVSKFTITGKGGHTYTLTDAADVEITSATQFTLNLNSTDRTEVEKLLNKNGTLAQDGTAYNIAVATGWCTAFSAAPADVTANPIVVSNASITTDLGNSNSQKLIISYNAAQKTISFSDNSIAGSVTIYNLKGVLIQQSRIIDGTVNVSNLSYGVYILKAKLDDKFVITKIVVE